MTHTHPDQAAFIAAIRAEPDCDVARGAYADWLDERDDPGFRCREKNCNGTAIWTGMDGMKWIPCPACRPANGFAERAEFIRVQCESARPEMSELLVGHSCERPYCYPCSLRRRESELLMSLWPMGIPIEGPHASPLYTQHPPDRGFLSRLRVRFDLLQTYYPGVIAHPDVVLRVIELTTWPTSGWALKVGAELLGLGDFWGELLDRQTIAAIAGLPSSSSGPEIRRLLGFKFPGHCPNHPIKWILPGERT